MQAEEAYRQANQVGREPQPGLALLRLAQGQLDTANTAIRRVLDEAQDPVSRSRVLAAYVEIVLACGDVGAARAAADELASITADRNTSVLARAGRSRRRVCSPRRGQRPRVLSPPFVRHGRAGASSTCCTRPRASAC